MRKILIEIGKVLAMLTLMITSLKDTTPDLVKWGAVMIAVIFIDFTSYEKGMRDGVGLVDKIVKRFISDGTFTVDDKKLDDAIKKQNAN